MSAMASDITSGAPLIEAHGLTKHYQDFSLQGVDLAVAEGEVVGFVGQNGAGKSTTIKALLGLTALDGGTARILGTDVNDLAHGTAAASIKEQIGVVFDTVSMPGHLCVADVGRVHARAFGQWSQHAFDQLVREFDLGPTKQVKDLSRGMGTKLSLACALSHGARLLVLDEATAGLDPMARDEILDRLRTFVEEPGHAVLMSSHITSDLEKIADRVLCIEGGHIVFDLAKDEITDEMGIARCRVAEFETIAASGLIPERELHYRKHDYGIDLLVVDRFTFARQFPNIPIDHMTIDDYMALTLKGGVR